MELAFVPGLYPSSSLLFGKPRWTVCSLSRFFFSFIQASLGVRAGARKEISTIAMRKVNSCVLRFERCVLWRWCPLFSFSLFLFLSLITFIWSSFFSSLIDLGDWHRYVKRNRNELQERVSSKNCTRAIVNARRLQHASCTTLAFSDLLTSIALARVIIIVVFFWL